MKYCEGNKIKTMLVYDLSRFSKSLPEAVQSLKKLLDVRHAIIFTKFNMKADLSNIVSKVMITKNPPSILQSPKIINNNPSTSL